MRLALSAVIILAGAALALAPPAEAAQCVTMVFFDQNGAVIQTPEPVVAVMIGGQPAVTDGGPAYFTNKAGDPVSCPDRVLEEVRQLFSMSCSSEERRSKAAKDNKVGVSNINKGCANMMETLRGLPPP